MRFFWVLLILILPFNFIEIATAQTQTVFYIDPSRSDPQENGTEARPFDSWEDILQKTPTRNFEPGNTYLQRRGTIFYGRVFVGNRNGTAANKIIFGAYGSGARPIINGRMPLVDSSWQGPDANGVYSYQVTHPNEEVTVFYASSNPTSDPYGVELPLTPQGDTTSPVDGTWSYLQISRTIYYNPASSGPVPRASNTVFFYSARRTHIPFNIANSSYLEIRDFHLTRGAVHGLMASTTAHHIDIHNILADNNGSVSQKVASDLLGRGNGIHIEGHDVNVYDSVGAWNEDNGGSVENTQSQTQKPYNVYFHRCTFNDNKDHGGTLRGAHVVASLADISHGEFRNCVFERNGWQPTYGRYGVRVHSARGKISDSIIRNNYGPGVAFLSEASSVSTGISIVLENNLIINNGQSVAGTDIDPMTSRASLAVANYGRQNFITLNHNTIVSQGIALNAYYNVPAIFQLSNNIMISRADVAMQLGRDLSTQVYFRNNDYQASGAVLLRADQRDYNITSWNDRANVSNDLNVSPLFVDEPGRDYHLRSSSPLIGAGVVTASTNDIENNPRDNVPDIGAYEYQSTQDSSAPQTPSSLRILGN